MPPGVTGFFRRPLARPRARCPPPLGMRPSFLMSTWIRSPGWSCSYLCGAGLRTGRPVPWSRQASRGIRYRARTLPTVERARCRWAAMRCGPQRRVNRSATSAVRSGCRCGSGCGAAARTRPPCRPPHRYGNGPSISSPSPASIGSVPRPGAGSIRARSPDGRAFPVPWV